MRRLIIRPGAIGDCILAFPAMQFLSVNYTEVWISSPVAPLVQFANATRAISSTGLDLMGLTGFAPAQKLKTELQSFDEIVSWYGSNRPAFRRALSDLGVPCTFHEALPPAGYKGHAIDFFSHQVTAPRGLTPCISTKPSQVRNSVVIHPFSGSAKKNWPWSSFQKAAACLDVPVEWCAGPDETLANAKRFVNLDDLAQWMAGARLYIGNDSGTTHLAAAIGIPAIAIFTTSSSALWAPRGPNVGVLHNPTEEQLTAEANRLLRSQ